MGLNNNLLSANIWNSNSHFPKCFLPPVIFLHFILRKLLSITFKTLQHQHALDATFQSKFQNSAISYYINRNSYLQVVLKGLVKQPFVPAEKQRCAFAAEATP